MKDFNNNLKRDKETIELSVIDLRENGDTDAALNYLYFLRDEIKALIYEEKAYRKAKKAGR